ncbi:MAG: THUMP domain-containing protein [Bacilli bacterium]|nr:THUMP domain-containing protein [Bacilli bacterium]
MYDLILVRYGEMTLKKKNYRYFLQQMNRNIKAKLKKHPKLRFFNTDYRFYIYLNGEDYRPIIEQLNIVFGLSSYSLCVRADSDYDKIAEKAIELIKFEKKQALCTFKVETNRSDKTFPATSPEITKEVASRVLPHVSGLLVDVHNPDLTLHIDLRHEGTYIYINSIKGLGGFPGGVSGKGLLMLSGGIDSPVAGFLALKKGIDLVALHFASPPYTSDMALQKVIDLLQKNRHVPKIAAR